MVLVDSLGWCSLGFWGVVVAPRAYSAAPFTRNIMPWLPAAIAIDQVVFENTFWMHKK